MSDTDSQIAIIGGTGSLGSGLALNWARAGYEVIIGSREESKALLAAKEITSKVTAAKVTGASNRDAAMAGSIVVLTVPYAHHRAIIEQIREAVQGKIVVDTTVPLVPPKVARVQLSEDWPIARTTQTILGTEVRVVSAFHNVAAAHLREPNPEEDGDVLVFGNNNDAREVVISLAEALGLKAWHAGSIHNSVVGESLTSVLIFLNKRYDIDGAGIRITGGTK